MTTYKELKNKHQKEFEKLPIMFAYGKEQFEEGMKKLGLEPNETDKICSLGNGGFIKKIDIPKLKEWNNNTIKDMKEPMKDDDFVLEMFEYEMENHEYQYSRDDEEVVNACDLDIDDLQDERLWSLYKQAKKKYLHLCAENDWF